MCLQSLCNKSIPFLLYLLTNHREIFNVEPMIEIKVETCQTSYAYSSYFKYLVRVYVCFARLIFHMALTNVFAHMKTLWTGDSHSCAELFGKPKCFKNFKSIVLQKWQSVHLQFLKFCLMYTECNCLHLLQLNKCNRIGTLLLLRSNPAVPCQKKFLLGIRSFLKSYYSIAN